MMAQWLHRAIKYVNTHKLSKIILISSINRVSASYNASLVQEREGNADHHTIIRTKHHKRQQPEALEQKIDYRKPDPTKDATTG